MRTSPRHPQPKPPARDRATALPPGTPSWVTMELIQETIRVWQPLYKTPLSLDDAVTILGNVGRVFSVLSKR